VKRAGVLAVAAVLAGCAHQAQIPSEVLIEVPIPCVKTIPKPPRLNSDAALRAASDGDHVLMLGADRKALIGYAGDLRSKLEPCTALR
jgi:hypothetical protein